MNTDHTLYPSITCLALATGLLLLIPLIAMQFPPRCCGPSPISFWPEACCSAPASPTCW